MSVPKGKRGQSSVEFLNTARELQLHSIKKCVGFPKRYTFYVSQQIANCATRVYEYAKLGNSIYPVNQHEVQMRRDYFLRANAEVENLVSQIEVANELFGIDPDAMKYWMNLVNQEGLMLKAILQSDRKRYKNLPPG